MSSTVTGVDVCFWHKADMAITLRNVRFRGVKRTLRGHALMSAFDPKRTFATKFCCDAQRPISDVVV